MGAFDIAIVILCPSLAIAVIVAFAVLSRVSGQLETCSQSLRDALVDAGSQVDAIRAENARLVGENAVRKNEHRQFAKQLEKVLSAYTSDATFAKRCPPLVQIVEQIQSERERWKREDIRA